MLDLHELLTEQNVEECDARDDAINTDARSIKKFFFIILIFRNLALPSPPQKFFSLRMIDLGVLINVGTLSPKKLKQWQKKSQAM